MTILSLNSSRFWPVPPEPGSRVCSREQHILVLRFPEQAIKLPTAKFDHTFALDLSEQDRPVSQSKLNLPLHGASIIAPKDR